MLAFSLPILLCLSGCPAGSDSADSTAAADSGGVDTSDSGGVDTSESGGVDTVDTADDCGDTATTDVLMLTYSVWTAETQCWAVETSEFDPTYWADYGECSGAECNDIGFVIADLDGRCLAFNQICPDADPLSDPAFAATSEQQAVCGELLNAEIPTCAR